MKSDKVLKEELNSFQNLWKGGTTLPKKGWSWSIRMNKGKLDLNGIVEACITPFIGENTVVLEIGAGGGGWTPKLYGAKQIICFDALSAEHTGFWERVNREEGVSYHQVKDFECNELEEDSISHVFSYDVFCHISYSGACSYLQNLYPKLKDGANLFIMIADAEKYRGNEEGKKRLTEYAGFDSFEELVEDYDGPPKKGRWYFYGTKRFCDKAKGFGYEVVSEDVAVKLDKYSPIIHFRKKKEEN